MGRRLTVRILVCFFIAASLAAASCLQRPPGAAEDSPPPAAQPAETAGVPESTPALPSDGADDVAGGDAHDDADTADDAAAVRFEVTPGDSEALYRVQEQLAGVAVSQDAVGVTHDIEGFLVFAEGGELAAGAAQFRVGLEALQSDQSRRDNYLRNNTLQTGQYPDAWFHPTAIEGLPHPIPSEGTVSVTMNGDLTLRDTTRPVEWRGNISFGDDRMVLQAELVVLFEEFNITKPRVAVVVSVEDEIRLEAVIHLHRVND
ncbi:MAG: YceI family protein [Thermaerobacterales bacterium]